MTGGLMGWAGVRIDTTNMMIGGIILGPVVDDTIHVMHRFQRYSHQNGDALTASSPIVGPPTNGPMHQTSGT